MAVTDDKYEFTGGSDWNRDGWFLETSVQATNPLRQVADVFHSDTTDQFVLSCFEETIPPELIEASISDARAVLPL